ncbi:MAG: transcriptional regulator [Chloroflexota bacterium]|nr:transcriptional regulator [Chloroflexota bacterium]
MDDGLRDLAALDRLVHEPARLVILALLYPAESADFLFLLNQSGLTKGNLSSHLAKLEQAGYVEVLKGYNGKVPHTMLRLTEAGRTAYKAYRKQMKRAVEQLPE